jgi:pimeloyl-ACP methyl ester carboxylesterase
MAVAEPNRLSVAGGTIAAFRFAPSGPAKQTVNRSGGWPGPVLVVHGWSSRAEHMLAIIDGLRQVGREVVAIDLPGHGRSSGRTLNVPMGVEAVEAAWRHYGPFETMIGHSFGGVVIVNAAQGSVRGIQKLPPQRLVLISAPASVPRLFDGIGAWFGLRPKAQAVFENEVLRLTGRPVEAFDGVSQLAEIGAPALVIHAPDDKEVGFDNAETYAAAGPHVQLSRADGLGHRRIIGAASTVQQVVGFAEDADMALAGCGQERHRADMAGV